MSSQGFEHQNAGFITISGGDTSILPGKAGDSASNPVDVPVGVTNQDGTGSPGGAHASPGDPGYTAIWNTPSRMFSLTETITPKESGPPPHVHTREDESFLILEGTFGRGW